MSKLTKQEINAIASKLHRDLEEKVRLERLRAIHEYIESPEYIEVNSSLEKIQKLEKEVEELKKEKGTLGRRINQIFDKLGISRNYWNLWESCEYYDQCLEKIIKTEVKVPSVPSIEELKDDIIIAAIDSDFNVEDYLKSQLEKY